MVLILKNGTNKIFIIHLLSVTALKGFAIFVLIVIVLDSCPSIKALNMYLLYRALI